MQATYNLPEGLNGRYSKESDQEFTRRMEMKMKAKQLQGLTFPSLAAAINAAKSQRTGHIEKWNSVSKKGGRNQVWFEWRPTDATLGSKSGEITPGKASCTHEVVARIMGDCVLTATSKFSNF